MRMDTANSAPIILTVSQLTQAIKLQLESTFPHVMLKGEISNLKLQTSGHLYFSLKDEWAQVSCVMFRLDVSKIQVPLKIGDQVLVRGELSVFAPKGSYQLVVRELSLVGLGELLARLEQLKQKLYSLGWFAPERKKPLPAFPKRIGVVTSPTGAVIRDIIHVLTRRLKGFHLILNPVRVQGEGAAEEIAEAINQFNKYNLADVLIVCRGGGSIEDLMPFNDEKVAEAIFKSHIPIISAVGHETDTSISDFVADIRAPTPSAAAEIVSFEQQELLSSLAKYRRQMLQLVAKTVTRNRQELTRIQRHSLFTSPLFLLKERMQHLDQSKEELGQSMKRQLSTHAVNLARLKRSLEMARPTNRIQERKNHLLQIKKSIDTSLLRIHGDLKRRFIQKRFEKEIPQLVMKEISLKKKGLDGLISHLHSLNPKSVLSKGYSIVFSQKDGSVISSVKALQPGQNIRLLLQDGEAESQIIKIHDTSRTHI